MQLNRDLMEAILSRQAILFVGSGASCALGYPTWIELLDSLWARVSSSGTAVDEKTYNNYKNNSLPKAFEYIENVIGRDQMLQFIKEDFIARSPNAQSLYDIVVKWPFSCYCTTNYDHEIAKHLNKAKRRFIEVGNKKSDFDNIHASMKNYIFQLHGNLENDDLAIITQGDYDKISTDVVYEYYREGLKSLFRMRKCIIIGYSCEDEDIKMILRIVRSCINSANNTFMFLADASDEQILDLKKRFSISVINYHTRAGGHEELVRCLQTMDRFISGAKTTPIVHTEDSEKAIALYLCGTMYKNRRNVDFSNYILLNIKEEEPLGVLATRLHVTESEIRSGIQSLLEMELIEIENKEDIRVTKKGLERIDRCKNVLKQQRKAAYDDFLNAMGIVNEEGDEYVRLADEVLVRIFQKRGHNLTQNIFKQTDFTSGGVLDVYGILAEYASQISDTKHMLNFVNAIHDFVIAPTEFQKTYLTGLAQGYFLYYLIGSDARTADVRKKIFWKTAWYVDSNVLIPLLAKGCYLHEYSCKLFKLLRKIKTRLLVTPGVIEEVRRHMEWAKNHVIDKKVEEWMQYATMEAGNNLNLFIDGYIHEKSSGQVASFESYCYAIESRLNDNGKRTCSEYGLTLQPIEDIYLDTEKEKFDSIFGEIRANREKAGTYKNEHQVRTEAEIAYLANKRLEAAALHNEETYVYFLSQSPILSRINKKICVWTSEALFRYAEAISAHDNASNDDELFHSCLLGEVYTAGEAIIDKNMYETFFKEEIDAATRTFNEELPLYVKHLEAGVSEEEMSGSFMRLPPLEKPAAVKRLSIHLRQSLGKIEELHKEEIAAKDKVIQRQKEAIKEYNAQINSEKLKHSTELSMKDKENERLKEDNDKKARSIRVLEATIRNLKKKKKKSHRKKNA